MICRRRRSAGFTWVELLVVIGILGLLLGMLLPAMTGPRERSQVMQCANHLKQIGTALLNHNGRHNVLPPGLPNCKTADWHQVEGVTGGADCQGPNWMTAILLDIEEGREHDNWMKCLEDPAIRNTCADCPERSKALFPQDPPVGTWTPSIYVCPSDMNGSTFRKYGLPSDKHLSLAKGNYAGCFGSKFYVSSHDEPETAGVFSVVSIGPQPAGVSRQAWLTASGQGTRMADITDGTSKTIMVSEILGVESPRDARGVWTWSGMGGSTFTGYQTPNASQPDLLPICDTDPQFYTSNGSAPFCQGEQRTNTAYSPDVYATARSQHVGVVNVVLADMSAHTIDDNIDPKVWRALCTRAGRGEENTGVPR